MYLLSEAIAILESGHVLTCEQPVQVQVRRVKRGYVLTRHRNGTQLSCERFSSAKAALRRLRGVAGRAGIVAALDAQRYRFLFPAGSTLDWAHPTEVRKAS